ncbi:OLC1v1031820C1 [Oldenlandia corymbosa var. corymbosa]|uniref:OLC1v1031820C1 n=1 Tax=Oldenlandia corymbosa var. corymbosa TaxID=529605 RepID=A0AAV1CM87_OLDCO|nr:OLC1v1031820C1 [Oldenlandia corymbosa var. corymbosa]
MLSKPTQGCPSTLGANRKSQDFFERVAAREPHVKALFTEKVVSELEKDIGCKIKIEEKFIIVSGKDRLILKKGVDAVHKIKEEGEKKDSSMSQLSRSRSPERRSPPERISPVTSRFSRSDSQRSNPSPQRASQFQNRFGRQDKVVEVSVREDLQKIARNSPKAYGSEGVRRQSSHSRSPARPPYQVNSYNSYDSHSQGRGIYRTEAWDTERQSSEMQFGRKFDYPAFPQTLEELELEHKREAMDLARMRDKEEDEENYRHREAVREIRENYMKKLAVLRETHAKQWNEFLQLDVQKRQQQVQQHLPGSGFSGYKQSSYPEYDNSMSNHQYSGGNMSTDSRGRYPNSMGNFPSSRPHDAYDDFQRQRRDDYGKTYNRY